jgi:serine/threonine-protein kinase
MLAGVPPHEGGSAQQTIMRIIADTPRPVTDHRRAVPPHVEAAVMKALEKLPADRFASAADFARALGDPSRLTWQHPSRSAAVPSASRGRRWLIWAPTAVAVAMTVVAALSVTRKPVVAPRTPLRFMLAAMGGEEMQDLSISADGGTVAYSAMVDGVVRGYVRRLDALAAAPIPGADGVFTMALLPDGRSLALADSRKRISIVPLDGGAARPLVTSALPAGMSWSGTHGLVLGMPAFSDSLWGLSVLPLAGDAKLTVLTNPRPKAMHHAPLVLSDGVTVLYTELPMSSGRRSLRLGIGSLAANSWTTTDLALNEIIGFADGILVYRDGSTFKGVRLDLERRRPVGEPVIIDGVPPGVDQAVMASNGTMVMHAVPTRYQLELVNERGEGDVLLRDTVSRLHPRFSPDGKRAVVVADVKPDGEVWVLDVASRTVSKLGFRGGYSVDWTPDARTIVNVGGGRGVEYLAADGSDGLNARALGSARDTSASSYTFTSVTISPDGKVAVLGNAFGDGFNLMMRRLDRDTLTMPLLATPATELAPRFSPDGRWLAYSSDESGRQEVYLQPFPGPGRRVQVSTDGGEQPVWSADGRLFYRAKQSMMVAQLSRTADAAAVTSRRKLFDGDFFGAGHFAATYDVSPDGSRFLMARRVGAGAGQLIAWVDWLGELKTKLGK